VLASLATLFDRSPDYPALEVQGRAEVAVDAPRLQALLMVMCEGVLWWGTDGPIGIDVSAEAGRSTFTVSRAGEPPADPAAAFAGPGEESTKIGLHVARSVARALGGDLELGAGPGIRFRLTLPSS
jgi:hypothetical protein